MGEMRSEYRIWSENWKVGEHTEELGIDGKILELILGKQGGKLWTGCI
jgi:hypothetical protein